MRVTTKPDLGFATLLIWYGVYGLGRPYFSNVLGIVTLFLRHRILKKSKLEYE